MFVRQPGVLDVVVVLVAPLDTLLCAEVLVRSGTLLRVTHLVVEGRAGAFSASVRRPARKGMEKNNESKRVVYYNRQPASKEDRAAWGAAGAVGGSSCPCVVEMEPNETKGLTGRTFPLRVPYLQPVRVVYFLPEQVNLSTAGGLLQPPSQ